MSGKKQIYLLGLDERKVQNFYGAMNRTYFDKKDFNIVWQPDGTELGQDIASIDLIVLPLYMGDMPESDFSDDPEAYVNSLESVRTALGFRDGGYEGDVVLITDNIYCGNLMSAIERAGEYEDAGYIEVAEGNSSFLKIFSTKLPQQSQAALLRNILEGAPAINADIVTIQLNYQLN